MSREGPITDRERSMLLQHAEVAALAGWEPDGTGKLEKWHPGYQAVTLKYTNATSEGFAGHVSSWADRTNTERDAKRIFRTMSTVHFVFRKADADELVSRGDEHRCAVLEVEGAGVEGVGCMVRQGKVVLRFTFYGHTESDPGSLDALVKPMLAAADGY